LKNLPGWSRLQSELQANLSPVWWREVVRLVPDITGQKLAATPGDQAPDEARLWEGVHQFLYLLAAQYPVIVFLDDLQWVDSASLGLLGYLVRQDDMPNIGFIATTRNVLPASLEASLIQTLTRYGRLEQIQLGRLGEKDILAIAQQLTPDFAYPFTEWLQRNSEGNPFVLAELVHHLENVQILKPGGRLDLSALSAAPVVPKSVYLLIQARVNNLSDPARRLLDAAVAAGREFEIDIVARAAALSDEAALDAAAELEYSGFILPQPDGMRYRFDHNLTIEVAYQMIGEPRHRLLHRRMAEALEAADSRRRLEERAAEIAAHFMEGNAIQRAAPYAFRAGMQAAQLAAWHEAVDFYQQALLGLEGKERFPVLMALGQAYLASGALLQASNVYQQAYDLASAFQDQEQMDAAALALGQALLPQSRYREAITVARRTLETGLPQNAMAAEFTWGTALSLEGAYLEEAAHHLRRAQRLCCEQSDSNALNQIHQARILFELGGIAAQRGELSEAIDLYRQVMEIACLTGGEGAMWCVLGNNNLAYHLLLIGDTDAQIYAEAGLHKAQEYGLFELLPYLYSTLGEIALQQVESISAAEKYFREGLGLAERFQMEERIAGLTANLGRVEIKRGNIELAKHLLTLALQKAEALGTRYLWAQIQLWLASLLPMDERQDGLKAVKAFAEEGGRKRLLEQIQELEAQP
jgi:predicted ATPase